MKRTIQNSFTVLPAVYVLHSENTNREGRDVRVGDAEARQVVGRITEEVKESISGQGDHLWDRLVSSVLWDH